MAPVDSRVLQQMLLDARSRTLMLVSDLRGSQLLGPRLKIVNPPLWEIGHLAWFQERWCLRQPEQGTELLPSSYTHADRLYDSSTVAHDTRWDLPLPSFEATLDYMSTVLDRVLERLGATPTRALLYFAQLAILHEEMHCEAFTYTRQTLGYARPPLDARPPPKDEISSKGDVLITGGTFMLGATAGAGFVFDNEKWAHSVDVKPFSMAKTCVTNGEFMAFVEDAGYARRELWSIAGWEWRLVEEASQPVYWRKSDGCWQMRVYDDWRPISTNTAVMHVNAYEAEAYCQWARRRLPSESEWEYAASIPTGGESQQRHYPWGDEPPDSARANLYGSCDHAVDVAAFPQGDSAWGCRQLIGNVWEWTADPFTPYPGFAADPYKEYSEPWFGNHTVLRGGCFATRAHLIRNTWRNFYTPDRRDVFAGFRTCAAGWSVGAADHIG
ncbi:MAG TPA: selenoneine synthase SenA [Burkholderiales bacterium]